MISSASHRIARQIVELRVTNDASARELYDELSESFRARVTPVLDEVFGEVCPPDITMRIDRLEIDVGVVTREGLMDAISIAMRDRLASRISGWIDVAGGERSTGDSPQCLTAEAIALERIAAFLEHGVTTWRDASMTREVLEATVIQLIVIAPAALRRLLERVPPARMGRRAWSQLSVATRHQLFKWLGVPDPAELDRAIAGWVQVLASLHQSTGAAPLASSSHDVRSWLSEQAWTAVIADRNAFDAVDALGRRVLSILTAGAAIDDTASVLVLARAAAERQLEADHPVTRMIAAQVASIHREPPFRARRRSVHQRDEQASGEQTGAAETAGIDRTRQRQRPSTKLTASDSADDAAVIHEGAPLTEAASANRDKAGAAMRRAVLRASDIPRVEPSARHQHAPATTEPLWIAHAGVVIIWPFLQGYFEACGLTTEKRFVDDQARERSVLLAAHLATGLQEWGEHDLLLEKTLCGHPAGEPIASVIELRDEERRQANELLESVIGHWTALKKTSVDGLRRAFLSRPGTMTEISAAWKLEIARAGHDILLDRLPWGIGVVLLPWMEQPLHVEW